MNSTFNRDGELIAEGTVGVSQAQPPSGETFRFAVGEHLYMPQELQRHGVGTQAVRLSNEALSREGIPLILSEQNDPFLMTQAQKSFDAESGITPEGRLKFCQKQGYVAFDAPYIQPPLEGGEPVSYLRLCAQFLNTETLPVGANFTGQSISAAAYTAMILTD